MAAGLDLCVGRSTLSPADNGINPYRPKDAGGDTTNVLSRLSAVYLQDEPMDIWGRPELVQGCLLRRGIRGASVFLGQRRHRFGLLC